jgi:hypothetical protein
VDTHFCSLGPRQKLAWARFVILAAKPLPASIRPRVGGASTGSYQAKPAPVPTAEKDALPQHGGLPRPNQSAVRFGLGDGRHEANRTPRPMRGGSGGVCVASSRRSTDSGVGGGVCRGRSDGIGRVAFSRRSTDDGVGGGLWDRDPTSPRKQA